MELFKFVLQFLQFDQDFITFFRGQFAVATCRFLALPWNRRLLGFGSPACGLDALAFAFSASAFGLGLLGQGFIGSHAGSAQLGA